MPKIVDHDQRRAELVAAAWEVIAEEGIEGTTLQRIAEVAGCTTGRITHYFDSKDDVLDTAFRRTYDNVEQRMLDGLAVRQGLDALRYVVYETLPLDPTRRLEWRVWLAFWSRAAANPEELQAVHEGRYQEWRTALRRLVSKAVAAGELSGALDVKIAVDVLVATIDGIGVQSVLEPTSFPPRRVRAAIEQLLASFS